MSTEPRRSYATATERPTKEQAIVIEAIDKVPIDEYCKEIGSKIGPKNIHYVSKISRSRICMYVATTQLAQTLINEHKTILIQDKRLTIRPLFSQNKRIIISNVQPIIPNDVIEKALLDSTNIRPVSGILSLRAGVNNSEYSHCLSFRRQMYLKPEDADNIPGQLQIQYEGTNFWIYLSNDIVKCFICNELGHRAKQCPENIDKENEDTETNQILTANNFPEIKGKTNRNNIPNTMIPITKTSTEPNTETNAKTNEITNMEITPPTNQLPPQMDITKNTTGGTKRIYSETDSCITNVSDESMSLTPPIPTKEFKQRAAKTNTKKKSKTDLNITKTTAPISELENELARNPNKYPLTYLQLQNFLEKVANKIPPITAAADIIHSTDELNTMLSNLYPLLKNRSTKNRFSRIIKNLSNLTDNPESEYDSQTSETSVSESSLN